MSDAKTHLQALLQLLASQRGSQSSRPDVDDDITDTPMDIVDRLRQLAGTSVSVVTAIEAQLAVNEIMRLRDALRKSEYLRSL